MAKAPVIELQQVRHALKVSAVTGQVPLRDLALLAVLYSTGITPNEVAKLVVSDYGAANGTVRIDSTLRAGITFNGKGRLPLWANAKAREALDDYLQYRRDVGHVISTGRDVRRTAGWTRRALCF